jgi:HSP20 family molecular chaperone IbpA
MYEVRKLETPSRRVFPPAIDIRETDDGLVLTADLPGVSKDNLEISIDDSILRILGRVEDRVPAGAKYVYQEYHNGDYYRSFILSDEIYTDEIKAELDAGVLTLTLPKAKRSRPRRIEVEPRVG